MNELTQLKEVVEVLKQVDWLGMKYGMEELKEQNTAMENYRQLRAKWLAESRLGKKIPTETIRAYLLREIKVYEELNGGFVNPKRISLLGPLWRIYHDLSEVEYEIAKFAEGEPEFSCLCRLRMENGQAPEKEYLTHIAIVQDIWGEQDLYECTKCSIKWVDYHGAPATRRSGWYEWDEKDMPLKRYL